MKKSLHIAFIAFYCLAAFATNAQIYADSVVSSYGVKNPQKVVDGTDTNFALISTDAGVNNISKLKVAFNPKGIGGMFAAIKIQPVNGVLSANVLQSLKVTLYNKNGKAVGVHDSFKVANAELVAGTQDMYKIQVPTDEDASDISYMQLVLTGSANVSYKLRIYSALLKFICEGSNADSLLNYTHVQNPENAVTPSKNDFALMTPTQSNPATLAVYFNKVKNNTNKLRILLGRDAVLSADFLSSLEITVYNSKHDVIGYKNDYTLAEADLLENNKFWLPVPLSLSTDDITRAVIKFSSGVSFSDGLKVYTVKINNTGLVRKPFIIADGDLSICNGESIKLMAKPYTDNSIAWQWYKNNIAINGADDKNYTATAAGKYFVVATSAGNCSNISDEITIVKGNCFASSKSSNKSLEVYPNPFINSTNINLNKNIVGRLTVTDKTGNLIQSLNINGDKTITLLEKAKPGIYFINLVTNDGIIQSAKVLKQ